MIFMLKTILFYLRVIDLSLISIFIDGNAYIDDDSNKAMAIQNLSVMLNIEDIDKIIALL